MRSVDVLIVTALPMELEAARVAALASVAGGPGIVRWNERYANNSVPYLQGDYLTRDGATLTMALARPVRVGPRATAPITTTLTDMLRPACLAMCGVCAGNPEYTSSGDVVVADLVYEYDEGFQIETDFFGDHRQYPLEPQWIRAAQDFDPTHLPCYGPAGVDEARTWFLERLHLRQQPKDHPARKRYIPADRWQPLVEELQSAGLIVPDPVGWKLTGAGTTLMQHRSHNEVEGPPRLPISVVCAPMASGSSVVRDAAVWGRLKAMGVHRIAALEMEAATVATIAQERSVPHWLVAKGVMDRADAGKDDRYKEFAARASAEVLLGLLAGLVPADAQPRAGSTVVLSHDAAQGADPRQAARGAQLGAAASPRFTLPARDANFTGREPELKRISDAVLHSGQGRVFAIHAIAGMAGVGKTTLAIEVGHALSGMFADGQLFVDLKGHTAGQEPTPPAEVLAQLINAEGVASQHLPATLDERAAMWRSLIGRRRVLLILDNAADSSQVLPLLPGSPESLVIVTSRRALGDLSAVPIALDTPPADEAHRMFVRLAPRAAAEPERVTRLVQMCGNLPLAISLLSGLFNNRHSWTMQNLLEEAQNGLLHLRAENRTVAAAFELSYRGQDNQLQKFVRMIGLHPGSTVEPYAAAALAGVTVETARMFLDGLSNDHLMNEPVYRRYRMHDLVREHVRGLAAELPAAEREQGLDRLLHFYRVAAATANVHLGRRSADAGEDLSPVPVLADQNAALAWMSAEISNITACVELAMRRGEPARGIALTAALAPYLRRTGPWDLAIAMHARAASAARLLEDHRALPVALSDLGTIHTQRGDYPSAKRAFHEAMELSSAVGDRHGYADTLAELAIARHLSGDYPGASEALDQALTIYREFGDRAGEAAVLAEAGVVYRVVGDNARSVVALTRALAIFRMDSDRRGEAKTLADLGLVRWVIGENDLATVDLEHAHRIFVELGDRIGEADSLHYLGIVRTTVAQLESAQADLERSLAIYVDTKYRHGEAGATVAVGRIRELKGDHEGAIAAYRHAHSIYTKLGNLHGQSRSLRFLAGGYQSHGKFVEAEETMTEADRILRELDVRDGIPLALEQRGRLASDRGDNVQALEMLDEALRAHRSFGNRPNEAAALNKRGMVLRALGRITDSMESHEQALALARELGLPLEQAYGLEGSGRCDIARGRIDQGRHKLSEAKALYEAAAPGEAARLAKEDTGPGE